MRLGCLGEARLLGGARLFLHGYTIRVELDCLGGARLLVWG